jgi:hypothetical protein
MWRSVRDIGITGAIVAGADVGAGVGAGVVTARISRSAGTG